MSVELIKMNRKTALGQLVGGVDLLSAFQRFRQVDENQGRPLPAPDDIWEVGRRTSGFA